MVVLPITEKKFEYPHFEKLGREVAFGVRCSLSDIISICHNKSCLAIRIWIGSGLGLDSDLDLNLILDSAQHGFAKCLCQAPESAKMYPND
jgi:hypothetical protein